jgi:hypothetical protein
MDALCYCPVLFAVLHKNSVMPNYYNISTSLRFDRAGKKQQIMDGINSYTFCHDN